MKKLILLLSIVLVGLYSQAQAPISRPVLRGTQYLQSDTVKSINGSTISVGGNRITDVADPVNPQDAVTLKMLQDSTAGINSDNQTLSIDSVARLFTISITGGNSVSFVDKDTPPTGSESVFDAWDKNAADDWLKTDFTAADTTRWGLNSYKPLLTSQNLTYSTNPTMDWLLGYNAIIPLEGNITSLNVNNVPDGADGAIVAIQNTTGGYGIDQITHPGLVTEYINGSPPTASNIDATPNSVLKLSYERVGTHMFIHYANYASPMVQLSQVQNTLLYENGIASWDDVLNESSYSVQLYKDGIPSGSVISTNADILTYDFSAGMIEPGDYYVTVTAKGDNLSYTDGPASEASNVISRIVVSETKLYAYTAGAAGDSFLEDSFVESSTGVVSSVNTPVKYSGNPIFETAGESGTWDYSKNYNCVLKIDGVYHMWYMAVVYVPSITYYTCYATSVDGINWTKPNLGLVSYNGNTNNNIVIGSVATDPSVVYDPSAPADKRYIMSLEELGDEPRDIFLYKSSDGINWIQIKALPVAIYHEAKELIKREDGKWVIYYVSGHATQDREIYAMISDTEDAAGTWTDYGKIISSPSSTDQKYHIGVEYVDGLYYGIVGNYNKTTEQITTDLYVSRDGLAWTLEYSNWIPLGTLGAWDDEMHTTGKSFIREGNNWRYYYSGFDENHAASPREAKIGMVEIPYKRIGEVSGKGTILTKPFTPTAGLLLNVDATASNEIAVELYANDGTIIPGFSKNDMDAFSGSYYEKEITWNGLSIPTDTELRILFYISNDGVLPTTPAVADITPVVLTPLAVYELDEIAGTTAIDEEGYANMIVEGATINMTGIIGTAYQFDSATERLIADSNILFNFERTDAFSFSIWIYRELNSVTRMLFCKQTPSGAFNGINFWQHSNNSFTFDLVNSGSANNYISVKTTAAFTATNTWMHLVGTYDGSSSANGIKIYVNGVAQTITISKNTLTNSILSTSNMEIGNRAGSVNFGGRIDQPAIFPKELELTEIEKIYNSGSGLPRNEW